jgi:hypothetical protein
MGTQITYYTNDANIYLTEVTFQLDGAGQITQSRDYNTYPGEEHKITFSDSDKVTSATFRATPYSSSEFDYWVYRVGSISASPQETTDNPFTFNEKNADGSLKSIWIRAVGKTSSGGGGDEGGNEGDGTWTLKEMRGYMFDKDGVMRYIDTEEEVINEIEAPYFSKELRLYIYPIKYERTSKAHIFTQGGVDTVGYLSTSEFWNSTDGTPKTYIAMDDNGSGDRYNFFLNPVLEGGKTYYLFIRTYAGESDLASLDLVIDYSKIFPDKWDWGDYPDDKYAIDNRRPTREFDVQTWNDMVDKVAEIIDFTKDSWNGTYALKDDTKMKEYDPYNILTATRFNSLRLNIGSRVSTGITERVSGDIVYGDYFNILANCINSWIDIIINESG